MGNCKRCTTWSASILASTTDLDQQRIFLGHQDVFGATQDVVAIRASHAIKKLVMEHLPTIDLDKEGLLTVEFPPLSVQIIVCRKGADLG